MLHIFAFLGIAILAQATPACKAPDVPLTGNYPNPGLCTGDCWAHDPSLIQRNSDGMYFRFSTGTGVNTMIAPSLEGPWEDIGAALPNGSRIQLSGVDNMNLWVCASILILVFALSMQIANK